MKSITYVVALLFCSKFTTAQKETYPDGKIIIMLKGTVPNHIESNSISIGYSPVAFKQFIYPLQREEQIQTIKNGIAKWEFPTNMPVQLRSKLFSSSIGYIGEPGDSICIQSLNGKPFYLGKGAEKFRITQMVESFLDSLRKPQGLSHPDRAPASSLEDYLRWNNFLNEKTKNWLKFLENNKKDISYLVYEKLKGTLINKMEKIRLHKFHSIRRSTIVGPVNHYGLSNEDLCLIYDSTVDNASSKWLRYGRSYVFDPDYAWDMLHDEDYRRHRKFFRTSESDTAILGQDPEDHYITMYNMIKEKYTGIVRENFLAYTFRNPIGIIRKVGFTPKTEALLADYYVQPDYPESKRRVKDYEIERRTKWNLYNAPAFTLTNTKGELFTSQQLKDKVAVIDFWFTGCTGCVQMAPELRKVEEYFARDTNIIFLSVSIDKDKEQWIKSISQKKYTSGGGIQLYTDGLGKKHDIITQFFVDGYPTLEILDPKGLFLKYDRKKIDPRIDNGYALKAFLQKQLAILNDGPYVFNEEEGPVAYSINGSRLNRKPITSREDVLQVQTDSNTTFPVTVMTSIQSQPSEFPKPEKLFVLSDIEGNFDAFRKLLQSNKIIDENYNWLFGDGHLVFAGDMFDRGRQVTECLWLTYSLEVKAKAHGGYVHFILGNHEIMNLQGDHYYVEQKYKDNAELMKKNLTQLYNENSELGRWLRSKNIVEKIGDLLFLHGGISRALNQIPLSVADINRLARPHYAMKKDDYQDERINCLMNPRTSPFWYRSYYDDKNEMPQIIDSTLRKFNVNRIVTGHTIVSDTISIHYEGKVINTDTKHAESNSEALLIEGGHYFRVNREGRKIKLLSEPRKQSAGMAIKQ